MRYALSHAMYAGLILRVGGQGVKATRYRLDAREDCVPPAGIYRRTLSIQWARVAGPMLSQKSRNQALP